MTENQKKEEKNIEKKSNKPKTGDAGSGSEDQKKRSYYYDDSCGYEIYGEEETEEDEA